MIWFLLCLGIVLLIGACIVASKALGLMGVVLVIVTALAAILVAIIVSLGGIDGRF